VALGTMIAMLPNKRSGSSKKEDAAEEDRRAAPTEDERVHA
jgi:hypothetical protein